MPEGKEIINRRETWISLLRVICMFGIILFHFADHGTVNMGDAPLTVNWVILAFCRCWGGVLETAYLF